MSTCEDLDRQFREALSGGERVEQPTERESVMQNFVLQRRAESMIPGRWVEHHYRPSQRVMKIEFDLGTVVITRGVQAALEIHLEGMGLQRCGP